MMLKSFTPRTRQGLGALTGLLLVAASVGTVNTQPLAQASPAIAPAELNSTSVGRITVSRSVKNDVSLPLREVPVAKEAPLLISENENRPSLANNITRVKDTVVQPFVSGREPDAIGAPIANFEGVNTRAGVSPPDTNGEVGKTQYVQMTNAGFAVYDKLGTLEYGPSPVQTLWYNFGGSCEFNNDGDPMVIYDQLADRWLLSQFAVPGGSQGYHECVAVSQTGDATGAYYRYDFFLSNTLFFDYPQFGLWPDGYYASFNVFDTASGNAFVGGALTAYDRDQMLVGQPATVQVYIDAAGGGFQPTDLDGTTLPPAGLGNMFAEPDNNATGVVRAFMMTPNWSNPSGTTVTGPFTITVAPWNELCPSTSRQACVPQPTGGSPLEAIGGRFMHRMAYRNFNTYGSWVALHTVDASTNQAGTRWYEFRNTGTANPTTFQQGTYAGQAANTDHRWMGSIAEDRFGNMGLGFSISSPTMYASIRYTGRVLADTAGTMPQGEQVLLNGSGISNASNRWGDYSSLTVDPVDDCTFYYTNEYIQLPVTNIRWNTRIGSFRLPGCTGAPVATQTATGTPATATSTATRQPTQVASATVTGTTTPQATATPTALSGCNTTVISGSFTDSDPRAATRYFPSFQSSLCDAPTTFAGTQAGTPHYDSYTFYNATGGPQCVSVHVDTPCTYYTNQRIYSAAYLNSFNPADISENWLGDIGGPAPNNNAYQFTVPAGATYDIVMA
jgi:hypothetical protein